ncbi:transcription factor SPEECHLESS-like [Arachis stenosperma]|uniref:transcription factor SPEECHLESS-like n=1 Tax=Arachis stenosperma TaxID=217475 RepID=UPI0025ACD4EC|nr:transcription factor SPEECHLESS-like [Arachis stenosperma]
METEKLPAMDNNSLLCESLLNNTREFGGEDLFSILESLEDLNSPPPPPPRKRQKVSASASEDGEERVLSSHITVERNRRKQMNHHLSVLRSLMPSFYVKRGDQASIIGGVVDYINELQQVLQCLEAKKHRKVFYTDNVLSPRLIIPSPKLSPRILTLPPISPRTPQPGSPWLHHHQQACSGGYISNNSSSIEPSPSSSGSDNMNELVANSKSEIADVEVKFCGPHVLVKTVSPRIPGQAMRIVSALQHLALEILHLTITTSDETMLYSFTIKIGIECQLSAEELAQHIQQTFC